MMKHQMVRSFLGLIVILVMSCASSNWMVPSELLGTWTSDINTITVRTKPEGKWKFTKGEGLITFTINADRSATGSIGMSSFENVPVERNDGILPASITGIAYKIDVGMVGKLFDGDPSDSKHVALWLTPIKNDVMEAELRLQGSGAQNFPMAGMKMRKK